MGRVFKKKRQAPLPTDASIAETKQGRVAQWTDDNGRRRSAPLSPDGTALLVEGGVYVMRYADAQGRTVERSTGCREKGNAMAVLREAETRVEKIRAGVLTIEDASARDWARAPMAEHMEAFRQHMEGRGLTAPHIAKTCKAIAETFEWCGWNRLADVNRRRFESFLTDSKHNGRGARTRNHYRGAVQKFMKWAEQDGRAASNPLAAVARASERADRRHHKRAFTLAELNTIFEATRHRPLHDRVKRNAGMGRELRDAAMEQYDWIGRERRVIYMTMYYCGLRTAEARRLRLTDLHLDDDRPRIEIPASIEKSRRGSTLPLRADLAEELASHITMRLERAQRAAQAAGRPVPMRLDMEAPLFPDFPRELGAVLDADLRFAGIAKVDERGRALCPHSFRYSLASHMNAAGVAPRVAQAAMRHASLDLTMTTYTDLSVLDIGAAVERLPGFDAPAEMAKAVNASPERPPQRPPGRGKKGENGAIAGSEASTQDRTKGQQVDTDIDRCLQGLAQHGNTRQGANGGGPGEIRTLDQVIMSHLDCDCKPLQHNTLAEHPTPASPPASPQGGHDAPAPDPAVLALAERLAAIPPEHRAALIALLGSDDAKGNR